MVTVPCRGFRQCKGFSNLSGKGKGFSILKTSIPGIKGQCNLGGTSVSPPPTATLQAKNPIHRVRAAKNSSPFNTKFRVMPAFFFCIVTSSIFLINLREYKKAKLSLEGKHHPLLPCEDFLIYYIKVKIFRYTIFQLYLRLRYSSVFTNIRLYTVMFRIFSVPYGECQAKRLQFFSVRSLFALTHC